MRREISSSITSIVMVFAIVIIAIIIPISLYRTLLFPESLNIFLSSLSMLTGFFTGRWILNLKRVELTEKGLYISSDIFFDNREIFVAFEEIESVHQSFFARKKPEIVSIKFLVNTSFGRKIWFIPKTRFLGSSTHPIVAELNAAIKYHKRFIS
jgi:hypothetical protein